MVKFNEKPAPYAYFSQVIHIDLVSRTDYTANPNSESNRIHRSLLNLVRVPTSIPCWNPQSSKNHMPSTGRSNNLPGFPFGDRPVCLIIHHKNLC